MTLYEDYIAENKSTNSIYRLRIGNILYSFIILGSSMQNPLFLKLLSLLPS